MKPLPTLERLQEVLAYCRVTGVFTWKITTARNMRVGDKAGTNCRGYVQIKVDGTFYKAHRLAWLYVHGQDPGEHQIDHRDRNRANNLISNLRLATHKQNQENLSLARNNTSGVRGVCYNVRDKLWYANIRHHQKLIHLGCFKDIKPAIAARKKAEAEMFTHAES